MRREQRPCALHLTDRPSKTPAGADAAGALADGRFEARGSLGVAPRTHCEMKSFRLLLFPASLCNAGPGEINSLRWSAGP